MVSASLESSSNYTSAVFNTSSRMYILISTVPITHTIEGLPGAVPPHTLNNNVAHFRGGATLTTTLVRLLCVISLLLSPSPCVS